MNLANMDDSGSGLPGSEKRRSKLGYHRTSVACVHCRRRKIRCLPAEKDPQGRCQNCIRLKKECMYNPVEHPAPNERQQPTQRRGGPEETANSISSSSGPTTPSAANGLDQFGFPSTDPSGQALGNTMGMSQDSAHSMPSPFSYGAPARHNTWSGGYADDTSMTDSGYPMTPNRFPTASRAMSVGGPQQALGEHHHPNLPWIPTRSASFGGVSDMNHYPVPEMSQQQFSMPYHFQHPSPMGTGGSVPQSPAAVSVMSAMSSPPADQMMSPYGYNQGWIPTTGTADDRSRSFGGQWMQ